VKTCSRCKLEKPIDQFQKAKGYRDGHKGTCKTCKSFLSKIWAANNRERLAEIRRNWIERNRERRRETNRKSVRNRRLKNPEVFRAKERVRVKRPEVAKKANRLYYLRNKDARLAYNAAYNRANPHRRVAHKAKRRAIMFKAKPIWANDSLITDIYRLAKLREKHTGQKWHVDHTVPINSPLVCGLHVETNLQAIPATSNLQKSNLHWPDMP
jgi:hypothetical protein